MKPNNQIEASAARPSWFASQGIPACSMWGKMEIEILAWAYVAGMAKDGDTWHELTPQRCYELLSVDERRFAHPYLQPDADGQYDGWWKMIGEQLKDAAGAFQVGGIAWNRYRFAGNSDTVRVQPTA